MQDGLHMRLLKNLDHTRVKLGHPIGHVGISQHAQSGHDTGQTSDGW
jgi:hypothetical protein